MEKNKKIPRPAILPITEIARSLFRGHLRHFWSRFNATILSRERTAVAAVLSAFQSYTTHTYYGVRCAAYIFLLTVLFFFPPSILFWPYDKNRLTVFYFILFFFFVHSLFFPPARARPSVRAIDLTYLLSLTHTYATYHYFKRTKSERPFYIFRMFYSWTKRITMYTIAEHRCTIAHYLRRTTVYLKSSRNVRFYNSKWYTT